MKFLIVLFSFVLCTAPLCAEVTSGASRHKENYKDIIQKAQNLTLQQNRLQAAQVLVRVIQSENYNKKAQDELKKTLNDISTLFYTEKTQKLFEYAKSLLRESEAEALAKFNEALKLEPGNILILLWSARLSLFTGKCEDANQKALRGLEINPYYDQLQLLELQAKACLQNSDELDKAVARYKHLETVYPLFYHMILTQKFFIQKQYPQAGYHIERAKQIDREFPEIYYWEIQTLSKQEVSAREAASRYIRTCKTISKADYLKYELEPRLCKEFKAVESEYKGLIERENKKD
jgi:tetratricopeptide (TPR) repeat protein